MSKLHASPLLTEPEQRWRILGYTFEIWPQAGSTGELAIKVIPNDAESFWLKHPTARYETVAGAHYAILTFCEDLE